MTAEATVTAELSRLVSAAESRNIPPQVTEPRQNSDPGWPGGNERYVDHRYRYPGGRKCLAGSLRAARVTMINPLSRKD